MIERERKAWQAPSLQVYGDLQSITLVPDHGCHKDFGFNDGDTFGNPPNPIGCTS